MQHDGGGWRCLVASASTTIFDALPDDSSDADSAAVSIGTSSSLGHDEDNRSGLKCMGPMNPLAGTVEGSESFHRRITC